MDTGTAIVIVMAIYSVTSLIRDYLTNERNKEMNKIDFERYGDPMRDSLAPEITKIDEEEEVSE